ncbi:MAG: hypothetical protein IJT70_03720 [Clostridia bacterium]|nr:hypothetical protein [Clostridia bacterium]
MTANQTTANVLCERLSERFANRGIKNPDVIERVSREKDKSRASKSANVNHKAKAKVARRTILEPGYTSAKMMMPGSAYRRAPGNGSGTKEVAYVPDGGKFGTAFVMGAGIRARAERFDPYEYERRNRIVPSSGKAEKKKKRTLGKAMKEEFKKKLKDRTTDIDTFNEKVVKKSPLPKGIIAAILLCTVMLLVVIYTYSSYAQVTSEGTALQSRKTELLVERDRLHNLLELRDDIREIEDYAVNNIGMVKSDLVETRYVSIAGGERIEVVRSEQPEESGGIFATLLNAMGGSWERLLEYLD